MLYKAIVLDNSHFFETGKIRVRVAGLYHGKIYWDLSENYPDAVNKGEIEGKIVSQDFEAKLFTPLGGGRNYGVLMIPQINEVGIISFLGGNRANPIWLGSIFEPRLDEQGDIAHVNIPSDKPENEGEDSDGIIDGEQNMDAEDATEALEKNIVLRTKHTTGDSADTVNWNNARTSNIVSIEKKRLRIRHFSDEDGWNETTPEKWQDISISRDEDKETISLTVENTADEKKGTVKLTEDGLDFTIDNGGDLNTLSLTNKDDEVGVHYVDKHDNELTANDSGWTITMSDGSVLEMDNSGDITIETKSGSIQLKGNPKIILNSEGGTAVKYGELSSIITEFENHVHITQGPAGPTSSAMKGPSGAPPIGTVITSDKTGMESPNIKVE